MKQVRADKLFLFDRLVLWGAQKQKVSWISLVFFSGQRAKASQCQSMSASAMTLYVAVTLLTFGRAYLVSKDASCVTSFQRGRHVWASSPQPFLGWGRGSFVTPTQTPVRIGGRIPGRPADVLNVRSRVACHPLETRNYRHVGTCPMRDTLFG